MVARVVLVVVRVVQRQQPEVQILQDKVMLAVQNPVALAVLAAAVQVRQVGMLIIRQATAGMVLRGTAQLMRAVEEGRLAQQVQVVQAGVVTGQATLLPQRTERLILAAAAAVGQAHRRRVLVAPVKLRLVIP